MSLKMPTAYDELDMLLEETRAVILAASADDKFKSLRTEDLGNLFFLLLRQLSRMREQLDSL